MWLAWKILTGCAALAAVAGPLAFPHGAERPAAGAVSDFVTIAPGTLHYRPPGEFTRAGKPADAPFVDVTIRRPLTIMRRQVTVAEYAACAADGACPRVAATASDAGEAAARPMVGVSWRDATAYAAWASRRSGERLRLPTEAEWAYAAGSRWRDEAPLAASDFDPSKRWLARYEAEAERDRDRQVHPVDTFGVNEHGLADMAGNVWEWTDTCYRRVMLDPGAQAREASVNCGVRVVAGRHRSYMTDFIRDARSGGCAFGVPPSHLGFRLVREEDSQGIAVAGAIQKLRAWLAPTI